ncbi:MAG: PKD domain-containing protein, partial [Bacteroidota bacterium]
YMFNQVGTFTIGLETGDTTCTSNTSQVIVVNEPSASISAFSDESCPGTMDGSIDLTITGGFAPYTYSWSNGSTNEDPSQLAAGTYSVQITDSEGCIDSASVNLSVGIPVAAAFMVSDSNICTGGTVTFTDMSSGATSYDWYQNGSLFNSSANPTQPFLASGTYDILLVSSNTSCDDSASFQINVFDPPALSATSTDETCNNSQDGSIDLVLTGGSAPFTYSWSNGAMTEDLMGVSQGSYTVYVSDSLGCQSDQMFSVNIGSGISADFTYTDSTAICLGESVDFSNTSSDPGNISWSNNGVIFSTMPNPSQTFDSVGTFAIQLLLDDGTCQDSLSVSFTVSEAPSANANPSDPVCPDDLNGGIDLSPNGGVMPYSFSWSNGESSEDLSGLDSGTYILNLTDAVGCAITDTFMLALQGGLTADFSITTGGAYVDLTDLSDSTAVSWAWDFGDGSTSTDQNPVHQYAFFGNYTICLSVVDAFGCTDTICQEASISTALEPEQVLPLIIYPNPASEQILLQLPASRNASLYLQVMDARGRIVLEDERSAKPELRLDVSQLASGVYSILLRDGERYFVGKFVRQ